MSVDQVTKTLVFVTNESGKIIVQTRKYKAIIFDCDGVLVDTERLKFEAWQEVLKGRGITFDIEDYIPLVGYSSEAIADSIKKLRGATFDEKELILEKDAIYHANQKKGVPVFDDAVSFLKDLINKKNRLNIKLALVSSAEHKEIKVNLERIGVSATDFDALLSGKDDLKPLYGERDVNKPLPYIYQLCSEKLGISPENCLVFEDTNAGVLAAVGAGMTAIATPNDFTGEHAFTGAISKRSFKEMHISEFVNEQPKSISTSSFSLLSNIKENSVGSEQNQQEVCPLGKPKSSNYQFSYT